MTPSFLTIVPPRLELAEYFRKPQVICRIIILVLAVIVIGVVHNDCQIYGQCLFEGDPGACGFALFLGWITILSCISFMIVDLWVDNIPNTNTRRTVTLADFVVSGCSLFLWFVAFCLLCNRWQNTSEKFLTDRDVSPTGPRVAIAFTFFSFLVLGVLVYWVHLAYSAVRLLTVGAIPNDSNNFSAYPDPSVPTYHGFTRDAEMLDPTGPTNLGSDMSPYALGKTDGAPAPPSAGAVFTGNLIEAYQP